MGVVLSTDVQTMFCVVARREDDGCWRQKAVEHGGCLMIAVMQEGTDTKSVWEELEGWGQKH